MRIEFDELASRKEWLHTELMRSLNADLITAAKNDGFFEVKLLVNGVELEPDLFNDIVNNIERYIDNQARSLVTHSLESAKMKADKLSEMIVVAISNVVEEFNLDSEY